MELSWHLGLAGVLITVALVSAPLSGNAQVEAKRVAVVPSAAASAKDAAVSGAAMAKTVRAMWPAGVVSTVAHPGGWGYEVGTLLDGMTAEWHQSGDAADFNYIKATVDRYVTKDGAIEIDPGKPFQPEAHVLDDLEMGRAIVVCYRATKDERYAKAAKYLDDQFATQPRTPEGGFWHKQIYPQQMWLDGAYMAEPFRAIYASTFHKPVDYDDIANQLLLMDEHMRDPATGLLRHGWDASRQMKWADPQTGLSQEAWGRAMGWYAMALVDTLEWFPEHNPDHARLVAALGRVAQGLLRYQDHSNGLWWDVLDKGGRTDNFQEASESAMFVYALAKGVRLGWLPQSDEAVAIRGWQGIEHKFITRESDGSVTLHGTVKVSGLGGNPYRAGDYAYYVHEKTGDNDAKGVGAYLLAASEMQQVAGDSKTGTTRRGEATER